MTSFREVCDALVLTDSKVGVEYDRANETLRLQCEPDTLVVSEQDGKVIFEITRDDQTARREYDHDAAHKVLGALLDGSATLDVRFPRQSVQKKAAVGKSVGKIVGIIFGLAIALGAGFCSFAIFMATFVYGSESLLGDIAIQIFFVGMLAAGIALTVSVVKGTLDAGKLFGVGGGFVMAITLLSLILGIWSTRTADDGMPLVGYISITIAFGIFVVAGIALMIYSLHSGSDRTGSFALLPRMRILPSAQSIDPVLSVIKERTAMDAIRITLDFDRTPALWESKLGGLPYWDTSMPYPCDEASGEKLTMLAQINLSQLPENDYLPKEGMLQFFILADTCYGIDSAKKVVYHKTVNRNVYEKTIKELDLPVAENDDGFDFPVYGELAMDFAKVPVFMNGHDNRFEGLLCSAAMEQGVELFDFQSFDLDSLEGSEVIDESFSTITAGHWIGGYPYFTQFDPRSEEALEKYDFLLLQLDTDDHVGRYDKGIMWGDSGVGQFFISSEALKRMELDDVYYCWDCC